ncbi:hypothetical protein [Rhizobium laguerreae]|uniref:hypothetical protein n=1 Tax=Rhizobium laguerreae TaxID=1076926 RepID=UPI001FD59F7F|nr:hypothetical protein [Rhizobium laguerreae]
MNTDSCPIPTPQERSFLAIQQAAEQTMLEKVSRAISDATAEVTRNVQDAGLEFEPTSEGYFMFAVQQGNIRAPLRRQSGYAAGRKPGGWRTCHSELSQHH